MYACTYVFTYACTLLPPTYHSESPGIAWQISHMPTICNLLLWEEGECGRDAAGETRTLFSARYANPPREHCRCDLEPMEQSGPRKQLESVQQNIVTYHVNTIIVNTEQLNTNNIMCVYARRWRSWVSSPLCRVPSKAGAYKS